MSAVPFHIVAVGWVEDIGDAIARRSDLRFSYIAHPRQTKHELPGPVRECPVHFLREHLREPMPEPDHELLASLEQPGLPTIHNIILSDRIVSKIDYGAALGYCTFVARRMAELFRQLEPSVVIASFDGVHSAISLAVCRRMGIPWYALNFSVIPPGLACFVDMLLPSARVQVRATSLDEVRPLAEASLARFESKSVQVPAYITPPGLSFFAALKRLPRRFAVAMRVFRNSRDRDFLQFTEDMTDLSLIAALRHLRRVRKARHSLAGIPTVREPPKTPYIFFGLHTQPESAIDVWAPFYANQYWVLELLSRALPASHQLLIKIHKSDAANYTREQIDRMRSFPGIELVEPFADSRRFVEGADLIVSIQGTMGLEAALLGKPVIMLGDSPVTMFPSASRIGELSELPALIRKKLAESPPARSAIVEAYAEYLRPFMPAAHNDWTVAKTDAEIDNLAALFGALRDHLAVPAATAVRRARER